MPVGNVMAIQEDRERVLREVRMAAGLREAAYVGNGGDAVGLQERQEAVGRMRRVADRQDRAARHGWSSRA